MKKYILSLVFVLLLVPSLVLGAGSVTITTNSIVPKFVEQIIFTCVGDAAAGDIPNTAITQQNLAKIVGMYLYCVTAYPVSGGTAPDAADVFILNENSEDLLGSADNVTAGNGLNLLHATLTRTTLPRLYLPGSNFFPAITGLLTLQVSNQATASADWVVVCTFVK